MAVYSMTGFASGRQTVALDPTSGTTGPDAQAELSMELRSVNGRFLDLVFRLPDELRAHEPALRQRLGRRLKRGKVEMRASVGQHSDTAIDTPATALLQHLVRVQDEVRRWLPDAGALSMADVLRMAGSGAKVDDQTLEAALLQLAGATLDKLMVARENEGARLRALLLERCAALRGLVERARPLVPEAVQAQQQRFIERWNQTLADAGGAVRAEAAQERALTEAAAYAMRIDVAEELDRLGAHLDEIESVLDQGGNVGKRLDFLIQELHREANTLGSKSAALELSRVGVDMKVLIEQMREQVQNIE